MFYIVVQSSPAGLVPVTHNADFLDINLFIGFPLFLESLSFSATHLSQDHLPHKLLALKSLSQGLLRKPKLYLYSAKGD